MNNPASHTSSQLTDRDRANLSRPIDYSSIRSIPEIWDLVKQKEAVPNRVALFADNSPRWLIADQGIMMAGAANAVRGATADPEELLYIIQDSGSTALVVENLALLKKQQQHLNSIFSFRIKKAF